MTSVVGEALWQQYAGAIAMLDNAIAACPDDLWTKQVWPDTSDDATFSQFWSVAAHCVRWLERYMVAAAEQDFASLPSTLRLPYPGATVDKAAVRSELARLRERCRELMTGLDDEALARSVDYEWIGSPISYCELQIYNLRHLQEHAAQLSLMLGNHGVADEALDWVSRAGRGPVPAQ